MELTLAVPCQAIIIFDAELPEYLFDRIYAALAINISDEDEEKTAPTKRLEHIVSLNDIYEALDQQTELKGRYIVFPNVTNEGKFSLLRTGMASKYKQMVCVGAYIDGSYEKLKQKTIDITSGKQKEWGNKKVALIQTSDNRKATFEDLGLHTSWIKWSVPTAEALRQACLADTTRIKQSEPSLPLTYIKKIGVSNSKFMGPINIILNPQYSAFIGGRGTGKSTVLEYLRWGLCDHSLQNITEESPEYKKRSKKLIQNTLAVFEGNIEITVSVNGIDYVVKRSSGTSEIFLKTIGEEYIEVKSDEIRALMPIHAYSQKQMSDVGVRVDELKRFVYSPIIDNLNKIDDNFESLGNKIRKQYAEQRQKYTIEKEQDREVGLLKTVIAQIEEIKKTLTGLSEADQKIINMNAAYQEVNSTLITWEEEISLTSKLFSDLIEGISSFPSDISDKIAKLPDQDQILVKDLHRKITEKYSEIKKYISSINTATDALELEDSEISLKFDAWDEKFQKVEEKYNFAKEKSTAHQSKLTRLKELEERAKNIRSLLAKLKTELVLLGNPKDKYNQLIEQWIDLHETKTELINGVCIKLTEYSKSEIKAELLVGYGFEGIQQKFEDAIKGSGIRNSIAKLASLREYIIEEVNPLRAWFNVLSELEKIALFDYDNEDEKNLPETSILSKLSFTSKDLYSLSNIFDVDTWLDLSLERLKDNPSFHYFKGDGEYIPFQDASAGQQATSLLKALLNQSGPPLIIDQPEDDLDNNIISEVVEQIWNAKSNRQIVFASHNANLVVNGDADLVVCYDYSSSENQSKGKIKTIGAIDIQETKESIKLVMEGGDRAFEMRRQKYGF